MQITLPLAIFSCLSWTYQQDIHRKQFLLYREPVKQKRKIHCKQVVIWKIMKIKVYLKFEKKDISVEQFMFWNVYCIKSMYLNVIWIFVLIHQNTDQKPMLWQCRYFFYFLANAYRNNDFLHLLKSPSFFYF